MPREPDFTPVPKNLQFRVGLLMGLAVVLAVGFSFFALYARGMFQQTQRLVLITDNAEGVAIGMDLNFSGFPIGRVRGSPARRRQGADRHPRAGGERAGCARAPSSRWER